MKLSTLLAVTLMALPFSQSVSIFFYKDNVCRSQDIRLGCRKIAKNHCCMVPAQSWTSVRFVTRAGWYFHWLDRHHIGTAYGASPENEYCGVPIAQARQCYSGKLLPGGVHGASWSRKGKEEGLKCTKMVEPDVFMLQKRWFNINYDVPPSVTAELLNFTSYNDIPLRLRLYEKCPPRTY